MSDERINICYGISDKSGKYSRVLGTSICSLLENTDAPVTMHIFHDETLQEVNIEKISELIQQYDQKVCFYDVSINWKAVWEKIEKLICMHYGECRFTVGTFFRLLMGELLEGQKRAIYLDADTVVNMDIRELWERETAASGLAAVSDIVLQQIKTSMMEKGLIVQERYFNAGVLLLDLEKFREIDDIVKKIEDFIAEHRPEALDQDFLNFYFPNSAVLPEKFNCFVWRGQQEGGPKYGYIYHYVNHAIGMDMDNSFNKLYFKYFVKTPWCDENFVGNLAKKNKEVNSEYIYFANMCAGKRRIAIGLESGRQVFSENFSLREEEMYIPLEEIENISLDFKKSRDIFLIFLNDDDYADIKNRLNSFGLIENVHFFNMFSLLGITGNNNLDYKLFMSC